MSLRSRLASITDEAPISRRLWFSPPMRLSMAVVTVVAVLALAFLLVQRDKVGPGPSESPGSPSPSAEVSATPVPSTEPTPTPEPTPEPTPVLSGCDRYRVVPRRSGAIATVPTLIHDTLAWHGAMRGCGSVSERFQCGKAAFFRSTDGVSWTVTASFSWATSCVLHVPRLPVATPDGLLAVGQERRWNPPTGRRGRRSTARRGFPLAKYGARPAAGVAGGPAGVVAVR